ncbi:MAG: MFS transporter, partial [Flavobacterium sp.]|nr:MFS transporter [Flavobacterium sp.]
MSQSFRPNHYLNLQTWHYSFIILGAIGIVWALLWYKTYRDPNDHPRANDLERQYIIQNGARTDDNDDLEAQKIRWIDLFRYRTVWGMMLGFFCLNFVIYFFLTWFPTYLVKYRGMDFIKSGFLASVPFLAAFVGVLCSGVLSDFLVRRGATVGLARKLPIILGLLISTSMIGANFTDSTP